MESDNKKLVFSLREDKLGKGEVKFCWQPGCRWLAIIGDTKVVIILDRLGKKVTEFQLLSLGKVKQMIFDYEGDTLAILQENYSKITIINVHTKKLFEMEIERNNKDYPTAIKWTKNDSFLGVGTHLGLIYIYNKLTSKLIPCALCHSNAINSCDWNSDGLLVTSSEDKSFSVTGKAGNAVMQGVKLKDIPKYIRWINTKGNLSITANEDNNLDYQNINKTTNNSNSTTTVSTITANRCILIYDITKKSKPIELELSAEYGNIMTYEPVGDHYIAVAFTKGAVSIVSIHETEIKNSAKKLQPFKAGIDDISVCNEVNRLAIAGESCVKIYDTLSYEEITDERIDIPQTAGRISNIKWSESGNILVVSTLLGGLFAYNVIVNESYATSSKFYYK